LAELRSTQSDKAESATIRRHTQARNQSIDVLRGVAILLVLGFHFPYYSSLAHFGWAGVNLFFVLSGFLVSGLLFDAYRNSGSIQFRRFFIRRGFKIWPSLYMYLIAVMLLGYATPLNTFIVERGLARFPWAVFLNAGLFLQNYTGVWNGFTAHIWSLCVEEHFYLILPLLFWLFVRLIGARGMRAIAWTSGASMIICLVLRILAAPDGHSEGRSHLIFDNLFCGVWLSYYYRFYPEKFRRLTSYWSLAVAFVLLLPAFVLNQSTRFMQTFGLTCMSIAFLLLLAWAIDRRPKSRGVASLARQVAKIGFYSYSIYLWHAIVLFAIKGNFGVKLLPFWLYVAASIALGMMMAQNTEQPFLRLRDRLFPDLGKPKEL
jgi:peptidoglycan/LPS O-acetylase OafA/YrhL